ncbi:MAG: hypothetical protein NTV95_00165 [Candidatus Saccharibacteria bacterium]|nr:hypothetical protein [Candidatus Saccharibacteria bacterium]
MSEKFEYDCALKCPQYDICNELSKKGMDLVGNAVHFKNDSLQDGYDLQNAARKLKATLLEGCDKGPLSVGGRFLCTSTVEIGITKADVGLEEVSHEHDTILDININEDSTMDPSQKPSVNEVESKTPLEYVEEGQGWIKEVVTVINGDLPEGDIIEHLPKTTERRADAEDLDLTQEQEEKVREIARRLGIGSEQDILSSAKIVVLEGGKPWKVASELEISDDAEVLIFAGSPNRKLGTDEHEYMAAQKGGSVEDETEYDMVRRIAQNAEGFVPLEEDIILPFGYDISEDHKITETPTGQFVEIGSINGAPVVILRVDRENLPDGKYRYQPDSLQLLNVVAGVRAAAGDQTSSIGLLTSTTYPSRAVAALEAGLKLDRDFTVGMYGRSTLAEIQGKPASDPPSIGHILGELRVMWENLQSLQDTITELNQ